MKIIEELLKGEKVECAKIAQSQNKGAGHTQLSSLSTLNSHLSTLHSLTSLHSLSEVIIK